MNNGARENLLQPEDSSTGTGERPPIRIRDLVFLTVLALTGVAVRQMLRMPLKIPGHSSAPYLLLLVFGSCHVARRGAASYMGLVAGVFGIVAVSKKGPLSFFDFLAPALGVELVRLLPTLFHPLVNRLLEGLTAAYTLLLTKSLVDLATGRPWETIVLRAAPGLLTHTVYGVLAGILAHLLSRAVRRHRKR